MLQFNLEGGENMRSRLKELRKKLRLTQAEFGYNLGLARNTIAQYESGRIIPSNSVILSICKAYNVSESWLLTGEGEMFNTRTPSQEIEDFLNTLSIAGDDNFKKRLILHLAQMKDSDWERLEQVLDALLAGKDIIFPPDQKSEQ